MFNLILKDILIQKKQIVFAMLYIIFLVFAFQSMGPAMFPAGVVAMTYMLIITSCAYEDKNNSYMILNSLPIKRSQIVLARYISAVIFLTIAILAYAVISQVISISGIPLKTYPITLEYFLGALFSFSLMNAIYFPIFFKVGYMKARFVNFTLFFIFFFGINILVSFIVHNRDEAWVKALESFFAGKSDQAVAALLMSAIAALLLISYGLSVKFYNDREF
ncbi:MAG: ABC-2 transporter permease [Clostridia bacterium]